MMISMLHKGLTSSHRNLSTVRSVLKRIFPFVDLDNKQKVPSSIKTTFTKK